MTDQHSEPIQGQVVRLSEDREVAFYRRDGRLWAADLVDGRCEILDAATWISFGSGALALAQSRRSRALESAVPISPELAETLECLHFIYAPSAGGLPQVAHRLAQAAA